MEPHSLPRPLKTPIKASEQIGGQTIETKTMMEMWREISGDLHLPDPKSKGCTKEYLKLVAANKVYRVERVKIQQYLVQETPQRRILKYQWRTDVEYARLDVYLKSLGKKPLGFDIKRGYPNEKWLMEIVRYEDPLNILDVYVYQGPQREGINLASNKLNVRKDMINKVSELLFSDNMRKKPKWKMTNNEARNKNKMCITQKAHIEKLERELEKAQQDLATFISEKNTLQGQLLSMCDGPKAIKVDYQVIADPSNESHEKKRMMEFMYG